MSKHSVGTWNFHAKLSGSENHRGFKVYAQPSGWYIADVSPIDEDGNEGRANAQLMSAAPDLLESLKSCEKQLTALSFKSAHVGDVLKALREARAAIAKATGEQS